MKTSLKALLACAALLSLATPLHADETTTRLREALSASLPGAEIGAITRLPHGDLYEVVINKHNIFYTDSTGEIALFGNLLDLKTRTNLTERRKAELSVVDFARLPLDKAIVKVKGNGSRKLAIFTDPDCPYCRQLERELNGVTNVTLYIFLFPLTQLHPDAARKATAVWCAPDAVQAWDDLMLRGKEPEGAKPDCSAPIADIERVAAELHINGTPGLIFGNGRLVSGAMPARELEAMLVAQGAAKP